jgi:hypothetical protein
LFGNTPIDRFFKNIYDLFRRWFEESYLDPRFAGMPHWDDPFPKADRIGDVNSPLCKFLDQSVKGDLQFTSLLAGEVSSASQIDHYGGAYINPDERAYLGNRTGIEALYLFDQAGKYHGNEYRDLWRELRLPAMAQTFSERSISIVNGIQKSAEGALPLKVESPIIEPLRGGQARNISMVALDVAPEASLSGTLPP